MNPLKGGKDTAIHGCLFSVVAGLWIYLVRLHLGKVNWYSDDAFYRSLRPFSLADVQSLFLTPVDSSGYYRPFQTFLFALARFLPVQDAASYQLVTIALILAGGAVTFALARKLSDNPSAGALAGLVYVFSATHLKPLSWVNQWYQASAVVFAAAALLCRVLLQEKESRATRVLSLVFWYLAMASNNGIHSFALALVGYDLLAGKGELDARIRSSADIMVLSALVFLSIYVFHSPLERAQIAPGQFWNVKAIVLAFSDYAWSSLVHYPGDARSWLGEFPPWYETLAGFLLFAAALRLPRSDRRYWAVPLAYVGGGLVIALHHHRWNIEYGAPLAFSGALLVGAYSAVFSRWMLRFRPRLRSWIPVAQAVAVVAAGGLLAEKFTGEVAAIEGFYMRDEGELREMFASLHRLDGEVPPGIPFLVRIHDDVLAGAPVLHYLRFAVDLEFDRRLIFFRPKDFHSGEGLGLLAEDDLKVRPIWEKLPPPFKVVCEAAGCRRDAE